MNRTLLLAAITCLGASAALAQSDITIYGRLNTSVERQNDAGIKTTSMVNNSSRIGFRGTEDLGGGLKALFVLEHGFASDTGVAASTCWGREATVGLQGSFGTLRLGTMPASEAYFATADYVSMHNHDTGTSSDALYFPTALAFAGLDNAIAYTTPTFGGASVAIQYGLKEAGTAQAKVDNPLSVAVNYDAGPMHLGLGYEEFSGLKSLALRALYELGAFTVGGYYERNSGSSAALGIPSINRNNFRLAGMYAVGSSEFHVNLGIAGDMGGVADTGLKQYTLAYNYNLSKRTKVYTFYTKLSADVPGSDFSSLALGVRHNF
jgi:predicted porin